MGVVIRLKLRLAHLVPALAFASSIALLAHSAFAGGSSAAEKAGAVLFRDKGCAYCHGAAGQGTQKGPSLADIRKKLKAPQITGQIVNGGQKMPSFRDSLTDSEVSQLVAYLRAKHRPVAAPVQSPTP
jgi:mono/diheme cytochrome c family protein